VTENTEALLQNVVLIPDGRSESVSTSSTSDALHCVAVPCGIALRGIRRERTSTQSEDLRASVFQRNRL